MLDVPPHPLRDPPAPVRPLLAELRRFLDEDVLPLERQVLSQPFAESVPLLRPLREQAKRRGLWAPQMPKAWGGQGLSLLEHGFVSEMLGGVPFAHWLLNCQAPDAGNMEILLHFGTDAQKERFLRPLVDGQVRSCFSMTEPDRPGSNPVWLATRARSDGDHWVIDGTKWFTSSADGAAFAVVMAVTDEEAAPHARASLFLVPLDTPGVRLVRNISVMGHVGSDWASHAEVAYQGVRVPDQLRLGDVGAGFRIAQERLGPGRIHHCMRWLGVCARAYELLVERAANWPIAPFVPLGAMQMMQEQIALSRIEIHAARLMVLDAAHQIDAVGQKAARDEIAMIKVFVARTMQNVLDRAVQAHGALGVTDDLPLAAFFRHERAARIYDGPDEVHLAALAKRALKARGVRLP